jgi:hypothetical protein
MQPATTICTSWSRSATLAPTFANRNGFTCQYNLRGATVSPGADLVAYCNGATNDCNTYGTTDTVDIYLVAPAGYNTFVYTVLENQEETVYSSPVDLGATAPAGTLVFDAASAIYPPTTYMNFAGNMGIGTTAPGEMLEVNGNIKLTAGTGAHMVFPDSTIQSTAWNGVLSGGDYAESVNVPGDDAKAYEPGDLMVIDADAPGKFLKSSVPYSRLVAGIYSTKPGVLGRRQKSEQRSATTEIPLAMVGIVPTKVSSENGPIKVGDLLVTSSTEGTAMKGTDAARMLGSVVGKALGSLSSGTGTMEVLVTLQ